MMVLLSAPASMIALVQASKALPVMLLSLLAGAIADQFDRRRVLIGAQWFLFIASAGLCLVTFFDVVTPWLLLVFTFLVEAQHFEPDRRADGMARIGHAVSHRDARGGVVRDGAIYAVGQERRAHRRVARGPALR